MVGTFDVENLGDLLFPYVAHHELAARIDDVELELFSYRAMDPPAWPLKVRPLDTLAARLFEFDLVIVGGGHLVRGDTYVAPGYEPTSLSTSHPYGLWLAPTLLALAAGIPVAWNAVGVHETVPTVLDPIVKAAFEGVDYLAVRDLAAARFVRGVASGATPRVVPDSVFGIAAVLGGEPTAQATSVLEGLGVTGRYIVVQPATGLERCVEAVRTVADAASARGLGVVELEVGPCHFDRVGRLGLSAPSVAPSGWPDPLVCAAIAAGAEAVVASSLHAGILAAASGVPLYRPRAEVGSKYEVLELLPGVTELPDDGASDEVEIRFGRTDPSAQARTSTAALVAHWDEVAALVARPRPSGPSAPVAALIEAVPGWLAAIELATTDELARVAATHARERLDDAEAHAAAIESLVAQCEALCVELDLARDLAAHLDGVVKRGSVRVALGIADRLTWRRRRRHVPDPPSSPVAP